MNEPVGRRTMGRGAWDERKLPSDIKPDPTIIFVNHQSLERQGFIPDDR
ncbi:MAG: hypothetical protein ACK40X_01070 [Armatimonadota bacterium]